MIAKDLDPFFSDDIFEVAGRKAEEQMAFYLRRAFATWEDLFVFNGLRLELDGEVCQIDHLILHLYGFIAIESKSVTTEVRINDINEWSRKIDGNWKGMASPLNQAEEQLRLLIRMLNVQSEDLMGKFLFMQRRFGGFPRDCIAAISDRGIVERPSPTSHPNVRKADQVCDYVRDLYDKYERLSKVTTHLLSPFKKQDVAISFPREDLLRTRDFLLSSHRPRQSIDLASDVEPAPALTANEEESANVSIASTTSTRYTCSKCNTPVSYAVARFCWRSKNRFKGKVYCMDCQRRS